MKSCRKLHFFCIFLQNRLRIWIIFCTFVPVLGIVPAVTIKYYRDMEKVEYCKLTIGGEIYRVIEGMSDGQPTNEFRVMKGRRIAKGGSCFFDKVAAVRFMLRTAFVDVSQGTIVFEA